MSKILDGGPDASRLNLVCLSEGYLGPETGSADHRLFGEHVEQFVKAIKSEPWYRHGLLNVHALFVPSRQSARALKAKGGPLDTAFKAEYGQGTRAAHVISGDDSLAKVKASGAIYKEGSPLPASHVAVLVNCSLYGGKGGGEGGGILWTYTDKWNPARWTACCLHEWGHVLGLADEYGTSAAPPLDITPRLKEPTEPNITLDPRGAKWRHLVEGAVEGADGYNRRIYRPTRDCRMRSFASGFCPVCSDHIRRELEGYLSEPLEEAPDVEKPEVPEQFAIVVRGQIAKWFPDNSAGCLEAVQWLLKRQFGEGK